MNLVPVLVLGIPGIILLGLGVVAYFKTRAALKNKVITEGIVVRNWRDEEGYHFPIINFQTAAGKLIEFKGKVGEPTAKHKDGSSVKIFFDPDAPEQAKIKTFNEVWLGTTFLLFPGCMALFAAGIMSVPS